MVFLVLVLMGLGEEMLISRHVLFHWCIARVDTRLHCFQKAGLQQQLAGVDSAMGARERGERSLWAWWLRAARRQPRQKMQFVQGPGEAIVFLLGTWGCVIVARIWIQRGLHGA